MKYTTEFSEHEFAKLQALSKKRGVTIGELLQGFAQTCFPGVDWMPAGHPNQKYDEQFRPSDGQPAMCLRTDPEPERDNGDICQVVAMVTGGANYCADCGCGLVFGRFRCGSCEARLLPVSATIPRLPAPDEMPAGKTMPSIPLLGSPVLALAASAYAAAITGSAGDPSCNAPRVAEGPAQAPETDSAQEETQ